MKPISTQTRVASLLLALLTTSVILGATVIGMQATAESQPMLVVLERMTTRASAVQ